MDGLIGSLDMENKCIKPHRKMYLRNTELLGQQSCLTKMVLQLTSVYVIPKTTGFWNVRVDLFTLFDSDCAYFCKYGNWIYASYISDMDVHTNNSSIDSLNIRIPVLLSFSWWQPDCYKLWGYHLVSKRIDYNELLYYQCKLYLNGIFYFIVHFGTLRLASRQPHLLDTQVMSWACHWPLTHGYSSLVLVMPPLNSGTSERACADRHLLAMSPTSMPSV